MSRPPLLGALGTVILLGVAELPATSAATSPSPFLPNATTVAAEEGYLQPYAAEIVDFRTNPIAKEYIKLADLVDAVPTWLEDLFVPLFLPGSTITIPIDKIINLTVPLGPIKIPLPAHITIVNVTLNDLDQFKTLRPLEIMKGGKYTWGGTVDLKRTTMVLAAQLEVLGHTVDATTAFSLTAPAIDFAAIVAFETARVCEVWGSLMRTSKACAVWPFLVRELHGVSGFNITTLRIAVSDFGFQINVTGLGDTLDAELATELEAALDKAKPSIIAALPTTISSSLRTGANAALLDGIERTQLLSPCNQSRSVSPTINLTYAINVSRICFVNNGAYDLKWNYQDCPANVQSPWSPAFPVDQARCMDVLGTVPGVQDGDVLRVGTQAIAGVREIPDPALRYAPASNTASFECGGTTLLYKCNLVSVVPDDKAVPPKAAHVCIINQAGFDLHFAATDTRTGGSTPSSGTYPINQKRCIDFGTAAGAKIGDAFKVVVHAVLGKTKMADRVVEFEENGLTATYRCHGTTLDYACKLLE